MANERLYTDRAELYDAIYSFKDYERESHAVREILLNGGVAQGGRVLEAACGTGRHMQFLSRDFMVTGFDLHAEMLAIARKRNPSAELFLADMRAFSVDGEFDGLICLFSAIAYLNDASELTATASQFAKSLRKGGVLVIEPFVAPETFVAGRPHVHSHSESDLAIARAAISRREGEHAILDMTWLVARRNAPSIEVFEERHVLWLIRHEAMCRVFEDAGFAMRMTSTNLADDRGLIVGIRR